MLKIQLLDGCGSDDYIWLFPGTKSDLLACWEKAKIPCLYFRPEAVKNFEGTLSECDFEADDYNAVIMHSEHDDNGDHIHILIVDGEEFRLHENEVYRIITKRGGGLCHR
ncbi:MAG: hypothetical protein U0944_03255 [Candidatus Moranbacteria bacterium]|nr:hypothetical protein [Candidatus Moranbacteria bacterium]